jgi:hypothetical protein
MVFHLYSKSIEIDLNTPLKHPQKNTPLNIGGFMSERFNFTISTLNNIQLPEKGRIEFRDTKVPELILRVTANGSKSFSAAKKIGCKNIRATLGSFPANTIEQAREKRLLIEDGIKNISVIELFRNYEENFKAKIKMTEIRQKSLDDLTRVWNLNIKKNVMQVQSY